MGSLFVRHFVHNIRIPFKQQSSVFKDKDIWKLYDGRGLLFKYLARMATENFEMITLSTPVAYWLKSGAGERPTRGTRTERYLHRFANILLVFDPSIIKIKVITQTIKQNCGMVSLGISK